MVPAPVRAGAAGPQLEPPRRPRRVRGDPPLLVRPRRRPASASTRPRCWSRTRRCPRSRTHPRPGEHPNTDRDELHDIYRAWRAIADAYPDDRGSWSASSGCRTSVRFASYLRPDELHTAFNFDFMARPWDAASLRASIDETLAAHAPVGAPATWVLSNHDVTRPVTRYGRADSSFAFATQALRHRRPTSARPASGSGRRSARGGPARLALHLPGRGARPGRGRRTCRSTRSRIRCTLRSGGVDPGRDGCRVPLALVRRAATVRVQPGGRDGSAVAQPAGRWARPDGRGAACRPRLDALALPAALRLRRAERQPPGRSVRLAAGGRATPCLRTRRRFMSITNFSATGAPAGAPIASCWRATTSPTAPCRRTPRRGCERAAHHPTTTAGAAEPRSREDRWTDQQNRSLREKRVAPDTADREDRMSTRPDGHDLDCGS